MIPMMVEILSQTPLAEDHASLEKVVREFVTRLTGKQTIYQMIQLCEEITKRGGNAEDPLYYKQMYNERLNDHIRYRITQLKEKGFNPRKCAYRGLSIG